MLALHSHNPVVLHRDLKGWVLEASMQGMHLLMLRVAAMQAISAVLKSKRVTTPLPQLRMPVSHARLPRYPQAQLARRLQLAH